MSYMYGNNVMKSHLGRITEDTPEHQGVVIYTMSDIPIVHLFLRLVLMQRLKENDRALA